MPEIAVAIYFEASEYSMNIRKKRLKYFSFKYFSFKYLSFNYLSFKYLLNTRKYPQTPSNTSPVACSLKLKCLSEKYKKTDSR